MVSPTKLSSALSTSPREAVTSVSPVQFLRPDLIESFRNVVGSRISGYFSDFTVARWIVRRSGLFIPEDRLRASIVAAGLITPLSMVAAGLTMQFWTSAGGLAMSLVFLFIGGIGVCSNPFLLGRCLGT